MIDKNLWETCETCIAAIGIEKNEELTQKLYDKMYATYVNKGRMWNYINVDNCLHRLLGIKKR